MAKKSTFPPGGSPYKDTFLCTERPFIIAKYLKTHTISALVCKLLLIYPKYVVKEFDTLMSI